MKKIKKRIMSVALGLATALSLISMSSFAAGSVEVDRNCELTIQYKHGDKTLSGVEFELYHVADIDEYAQFTLTEAFSQYPVEIGEYSGAEWNELATTLDSYIAQDSTKPKGPKAIDAGKTNENGKLSFPNTQDSLKPGLYLVIGKNTRSGNYRYTCDPSMVCIPGEDSSANAWVYDVSIYPKSSQKYIPDDDDPVVTTVSRKVLKRWSDSGFEDVRPDSIDVTLLKDGEEYDSATLSATNNWSYIWTGLDKDATWKVTEDVPDGYKVAITREGNTFVVKNSRIPTETITDNNPDPDPTEPDDPRGVLSEYDENFPFGVLGAYDQGMLPQTGTTWWLAVTLAGAGMLLLALGFVFRRKAE